jgi:hypothetical protein
VGALAALFRPAMRHTFSHPHLFGLGAYLVQEVHHARFLFDSDGEFASAVPVYLLLGDWTFSHALLSNL